MARKFFWSSLLLLLASVQSFASACDVRCAFMTMPAQSALMGDSMSGMVHCEGMPSASSSGKSDAGDLGWYGLRVSPSCPSSSCTEELSATKGRVPTERTDAALHALVDMGVHTSRTVPALIQRQERSPDDRSKVPPSNLISLVSNLRI
jgi:hypothetical protein